MLIECILGQANHSFQCFLLGQFFELEKFLPLLNLVLHGSLQQKKKNNVINCGNYRSSSGYFYTNIQFELKKALVHCAMLSKVVTLKFKIISMIMV